MANSESILVVDDNPANLRLLSQILSEHGYHVRTAISGVRALASVELDPPEMILLDIRMPDMDGYEVCRQLKANPHTVDIPILFISALDDTQDKVSAFSSGGLDYITKPLHVEEVIARVETHLSLRRLQRNLQEANQRMALELELAARVQASFMHADAPELSGWRIAMSLLPAKLTSGDFYDTMRLPNGNLGILIADVVDKGVGAALYMAMSSTLLRTYAGESPEQPAIVFQSANERLLEYATACQFVTAFLGMLNPLTGELVYSNAGHPPPLLLRRAQPNDAQLLHNTGWALGVEGDSAWEQKQVRLARGDALILYTDGITEAEDGQGFYGMSSLKNAALRNRGASAQMLRDAILEDVRRFTRGNTQSDDIALMVVMRE